MTKIFEDAVVVYPKPMARFIIDPQRVHILEPFIAVRDSSIGATSCYYELSDGTVYHDFDFFHAWTIAGMQTVTQYVVNEFGCVDQITGEVAVEGRVKSRSKDIHFMPQIHSLLTTMVSMIFGCQNQLE